MTEHDNPGAGEEPLEFSEETVADLETTDAEPVGGLPPISPTDRCTIAGCPGGGQTDWCAPEPHTPTEWC